MAATARMNERTNEGINAEGGNQTAQPISSIHKHIFLSLCFAGLLVLNVCWNGKQYMGTLLDTTRESSDHKWGPPR